MKKKWIVLVVMLALGTALHGENGAPDPSIGTMVNVVNQSASNQNQDVSTTSIAEGGSSWNDNKSNSFSQVSMNSVSNYESRTPPLSTLPPYLPYWTHGGWGTIKAYFPNGPTANDTIYETTFDPENPEDMRELRTVLKDLPHTGLTEAIGGVLNTVAVIVFGAPDRYHHGRGLEIINSVTRDRRPEGKPLLVFIDSNVDMGLLRDEGYAYMGKVDVEGDVDRNWDQAYKAAVTEALLWDVDILLVSGGMKGVTVGSNVTFPSAAAGYSQMNYSLSLMGAKATGITEGKGKAVLSADAYRFYPSMVERRRIPASLYDRIRGRDRSSLNEFGGMPPATSVPGSAVVPPERPTWTAPQEKRDPSIIPQSQPQGATLDGQLLPAPGRQGGPSSFDTTPQLQPACEPQAVCRTPPVAPQAEVCAEPREEVPLAAMPASQPDRVVADESGGRVVAEVRRPEAPAVRVSSRKPGITVSRKLLAMAGFSDGENIECVDVR